MLAVAVVGTGIKTCWEIGGDSIYYAVSDLVENQRTYKKRDSTLNAVVLKVGGIVNEYSTSKKTITLVITEHDSLINWNLNAIEYLHNNQIVITSMLAGELDDIPIMHSGVWKHLKQSNYGDYFYLDDQGEWFSAQYSGAYNKYYYIDFSGNTVFCWEEQEEH